MDEMDVGGSTLRVGSLRVGHLLEIERKLLSERRDPLEAIMARWSELGDSQRRAMLDAAFDWLARPAAVEFSEIVAWMNSPLGTAFALWLVAREWQPTLTWHECHALVLASPLSTLERIQRVLAPELWEQQLGNDCGQIHLDGAASHGAACFAS